SILMTSAPKSASCRTQVGPARTWLKSSTRKRANAPLSLILSITKPSCSTPAKPRPALLHECGPALHVVLAGETFIDHGLHMAEVARRLRSQDLVDCLLGRPDGQGRIARDFVDQGGHRGFELPDRHHPVHQTHLPGIAGVIAPGGEENLAGVRRADDINELLDAIEVVAESE